MGHTDIIKYRLPSSQVKAVATITYTTDTVLNGVETTRVTTIALETAGAEPELTARIAHGWLRDTSIAIELTEDGRLVSSSVESAGVAGKVLIGVVSAGVALAGLATGFPGVAAIAAAGGASAIKALDGKAVAATTDEATAAAAVDDDKAKVAAAYKAAFPGVVERQERYAKLATELGEKEGSAIDDLVKAATAGDRDKAQASLKSYETAMGHVRAELERLDTHFKTWRATTIKTRTEQYERVLPIDSLRIANVSLVDGKVTFPQVAQPVGDNAAAVAAAAAAGSAVDEVRRIWNELGVVVTMSPAGQTAIHKPAQPTGDNAILIRAPRRVTLTLYKERDEKTAPKPGATVEEKKAVLVESKPYLVMDEAGELQTLKFRKSLWAKRSSAYKFSSAGALVGFSSTATAAGAALAEVAGGLPGAIGTSLEQSKKIYEQVSAIQSRSIDERLAQIKKEIELKQQEIAQAGLIGNEAARSELERLKLEADKLQQRKTIGELGISTAGAGDLASIKQQIEVLKAQQELNKIKAEQALQTSS